jgi:hypothetical protein
MDSKKKIGVHVHRNRAQKTRGAIRLTIEALFDSRDPASYDQAAAAIARVLRQLLTPEEVQACLDELAGARAAQPRTASS